MLPRVELERIARVAEVDWRSVRRWARGQPTRPAITLRIVRAVEVLAERGELGRSVRTAATAALLRVLETAP